jgi:glutamine synthetase
MFDDVRFEDGYNTSYFKIDDIELPTNSGREYDVGNLAHRPRAKGGYFPGRPGRQRDGHTRRDGLDHARNGPAPWTSITTKSPPPARARPHLRHAGRDLPDRMQIYKYVVHMVAHAYGKTATFMPKPIAKDNGSGMHVHMSIWNGGKPLFAGNGYAGLSETALYFIGGVIKHAKALNAFTNPTTNSYKRLVPGFEAPVLLAYSSRNRSASCRIPYGTGEKAKRVEFRFPDPLANPYLAYARS